MNMGMPENQESQGMCMCMCTCICVCVYECTRNTRSSSLLAVTEHEKSLHLYPEV